MDQSLRTPQALALVSRLIADLDWSPRGQKRATPVALRPLARGHDSQVFEVLFDSPPHLVLKTHRPAVGGAQKLDLGREYARREFDALQLLWHELPRRSPMVRVPRPLALVPELGAVLMERCEGERLDATLRWLRVNPRRHRWHIARERVRSCGRWLGAFHDVTEKPSDCEPLRRRAQTELAADLQRCVQRGLPSHLAALVASAHARHLASAFPVKEPIVGRHCDFAPYNVLFDGMTAIAIDLEGFQDGLAGYDLAYFLGMLSLIGRYHLSPRMIDELERQFLSGYQELRQYPQQLLEGFRLVAAARIMAHSPLLEGNPGDPWTACKRRNRLLHHRDWFTRHVAGVSA